MKFYFLLAPLWTCFNSSMCLHILISQLFLTDPGTFILIPLKLFWSRSVLLSQVAIDLHHTLLSSQLSFLLPLLSVFSSLVSHNITVSQVLSNSLGTLSYFAAPPKCCNIPAFDPWRYYSLLCLYTLVCSQGFKYHLYATTLKFIPTVTKRATKFVYVTLYSKFPYKYLIEIITLIYPNKVLDSSPPYPNSFPPIIFSISAIAATTELIVQLSSLLLCYYNLQLVNLRDLSFSVIIYVKADYFSLFQTLTSG